MLGCEKYGTILPDSKPLSIDVEQIDDELSLTKYTVFALNQLVLGSLRLLKEQIGEFRYLGPLRGIPDRNYAPTTHYDESKWSDGYAAWDRLYHDEVSQGQERETLIDITNKYLGEEHTNVGYKIHLNKFREVRSDSAVPWRLRTMCADPDDVDGDYVQRLLNLFLNLPENKRLELVDQKNNITVAANDIGVGISQMIPVIVGAADASKKIFAVEQPELHIHPRVQCALADVFIEQMNKDKERTFLIETHSEHLILRLLKRIRENTENELLRQELQITPEDLSILYVKSSDDGTEIIELGVDEEGEFTTDWPHGFFEERSEELF